MRFIHQFVTLVISLYFVSLCFAQDVITLDHGGAVQSVAFSPVNNSIVVSAGGHNTIKLWNLMDNTVKTLKDHEGEVTSMTFSPDGKILVSGSKDGTIKIWDVSEWQNIEIREPVTVHMPSEVHQVVFHPHRQLLAISSGGQTKLLDVVSRTEVASLGHYRWVYGLDFSRDGRYLATDEGSKTTVNVWDIEEEHIATVLEGHTSDITAVKFSPDGRTLATSSANGEINLWSVSNWELLNTFHDYGSAAIDFSADGKTLANGELGEVTLWSVHSGERIATLRGGTGWIRGFAFSSDGTILASGGGDGTVRVQDIKSHLESVRNMVRLIYFIPSDLSPQPDIDRKLDTLIKDAQQIFAGQMEYYGFGRKTF